jgi:hypothetical protein
VVPLLTIYSRFELAEYTGKNRENGDHKDDHPKYFITL